MAKKNIDVSVEILAMFDSQVKLLEGLYPADMLARMDLPLRKSLVQARLSNLEMSRRRMEERNQVDSFSKDQVEGSSGALNMLGQIRAK